MRITKLFTSCTLYFVRDDKNKDVQTIIHVINKRHSDAITWLVSTLYGILGISSRYVTHLKIHGVTELTCIFGLMAEILCSISETWTPYRYLYIGTLIT